MAEYGKNRVFTEETRAKLSKLKSGENNGKPHSDLSKLKMSKVKMGDKNPMFNKPKSKEFEAFKSNFKAGKLNIKAKPMYVYNPETLELIYSFDTVKDCHSFFKIAKSTIRKYAMNKKPYKDYIFSYDKLN